MSARSDLIPELVIANRILYQNGVVDAFGHISVRHEKDPTRYLMSRHLAPALVGPDDIATFDLDSNAVGESGTRFYTERFIHGEIYKVRPDVISVVHCHAPQLIPFGATGAPLRPIYHMAGYLAAGVPVFEIREAGGVTDMLIRNPMLGAALAKRLNDKPIVLMRGHGATMVGKSIRQAVYRAIYANANAGLQMSALLLGAPTFLEHEEGLKAAEANDNALDRAWNMWVHNAQQR